MLATALLALTLTCPLAADVEESSKTRMIYLEGVLEQTTNEVEEVTLTVEIGALRELRDLMNVWKAVNCGEKE